MTLSVNEVYSGGDVRDQDDRMVVSGATGQGKNLQFVPINTNTAGASQLIAAPGANLKIKVASYVVVAANAVTVKFQSGTTDLTGAMPFVANSGVVAPGQTSSHWFETAANQALNINLGSAIQVSGHLGYFIE